MSAVVAVQKEQEAWPVAAVVKVPGAHARQDSRAGAPGDDEKVLSGQGTHTSLELAPTADDHVPRGHAAQKGAEVAFVAFTRVW